MSAGSGAVCGAAAGNVSCGSGLCCSETGFCGTGTSFCGGSGCQLSYAPACDGNQTPLGNDTSKTPRPLFGNVPYGVGISHCSVAGKVALSFDDGPYAYTTELLDLLKKSNVRATFFVVGNNMGKGHINDASSGYAPVIQRIAADGHQVASHTWSHQDLNAATREQRRAEIISNEIALADILGAVPTYFRPPYTRCGGACLAELLAWGYHVVNYIDTRDWQDGGAAAKTTYQAILAQHSPASSAWLALAHDVHEFTVHHFTQFMVDTARALRYDLVTVGECLGDPPANWYRPFTWHPSERQC
ncbi:carbohydrate esterase family 4 protein [Lasiosphaeria ovina]|uniref:Carbohydrate esterase family 4 protein n=1 Tax=Lasiosphaeria ovina TaxID=92902 RepID=A0AAE0KD25_9PEZI|nr:carbohydrate esterase family 4 protein [Lasiosphaeria ovina]